MAQTLPWTVQDGPIKKDQTFSVDFKVSDFTNITAYQFAIVFNPVNVEFVSVTFPQDNPLQLSTDDFGLWQLAKGNVRHVWSNPFGSTLDGNQHLFTYTFKAKKDSTVSSELKLGKYGLNPPMYPVAYKFPLAGIPLTLSYTK